MKAKWTVTGESGKQVSGETDLRQAFLAQAMDAIQDVILDSADDLEERWVKLELTLDKAQLSPLP